MVADARAADAVRTAGFSGALLRVPDERLPETVPAPVAAVGPATPRAA